MKLIDKIPQRWTDAILAVREKFPEAIIAGGALRDLDNGAPVKDVDIFVQWREGDAVPVGLVSALRGYVGSDVTRDCPEYREGNSATFNVYEFTDGSGSTVGPVLNVIACSRYLEHGPDFTGEQLYRFDIGLCKLAYDGAGITYHPTYLADKEARRLRIWRTENADGSYARLRRIAQKYPGWQLLGLEGEHVSRDEYGFDVV